MADGDPLVLPPDEYALVRRLCPTCLHDGVLERALERTAAAEAKLAAVAALCREPYETCGATGADLVRASDILAITGSEEETRDGR